MVVCMTFVHIPQSKDSPNINDQTVSMGCAFKEDRGRTSNITETWWADELRYILGSSRQYNVDNTLQNTLQTKASLFALQLSWQNFIFHNRWFLSTEDKD